MECFQGVERELGAFLGGEPGAEHQQHLVRVRVPGAFGGPGVVVRRAQGGQVHSERRTGEVPYAQAAEFGGGPVRRADHRVVGPGGPAVEPVRGGPRDRAGQTPGAQQSDGALVRDHRGAHSVPPGPGARPAQRGAVGDLQPVGGEPFEFGGHRPAVGEQPVAAAAGEHRAGQGDDQPLLVLLDGAALPGHDEYGGVPGGPVARAEVAQRGPQSAGDGGDEVGHPDDPERAGGHAGSSSVSGAVGGAVDGEVGGAVGGSEVGTTTGGGTGPAVGAASTTSAPATSATATPRCSASTSA